VVRVMARDLGVTIKVEGMRRKEGLKRLTVENVEEDTRENIGLELGLAIDVAKRGTWPMLVLARNATTSVRKGMRVKTARKMGRQQERPSHQKLK
jgi:hypothetical protein